MAHLRPFRLLVHRSFAGALLLAGPGCQSSDATSAPADDMALDVTPVVEQLRRGDLAGARALLDGMLVEQYLDEAAARYAAGLPEDGLLAVDRALKLAPERADVRLAKARGSLQLAEAGIARSAPATLIEGSLAEAFDYYAELGGEPEPLLGASRAALLLGNTEDALRLAREADRAIESEAEARELPWVPERVLAEAAFRAYIDQRVSEGDAAVAPEADDTSAEAPTASPERLALFEEAEDALARLLARSSDDPWAYGQLGDLYEWEERFDQAEDVLRRGLDRHPESAELYERLARVSRKSGGGEHTIEVFEGLVLDDGSLALPNWYLGLERFDVATAALMDRFPTGEDAEVPPAAPELLAAFDAAEAEFARCRELEPSFDAACRGYEVMCRNARGWYHYQGGDYEDALAAFLSTNDLMPRGIEWSIEGRLLSGISGLHLIGTGYNDRENWEAAGDVYRELQELQPDSSVWANNAGFFYRDAAVALEAVGARLCRAAQGETDSEPTLARLRRFVEVPAELHGTAEERQRFREAADELLTKARELMDESAASYAAAARLAPEDVRIVNDAALVLVYYTHDDLDQAEELLREAVALGTRQLEDDDLDEDARWELLNAWGDAHQNLGVLYANLKDDPKTAEGWFEKAVEIGPEPRPLITNYWLPLVRGELDTDPGVDEQTSLLSWGQPCSTNGNR